MVARSNELRKENILESLESPGLFYTNEFIKYDTKSNTFTHLPLLGARFWPRIGFSIAVLSDRVFIHGGYTQGLSSLVVLHDFYALNMKFLLLAEF